MAGYTRGLGVFRTRLTRPRQSQVKWIPTKGISGTVVTGVTLTTTPQFPPTAARSDTFTRSGSDWGTSDLGGAWVEETAATGAVETTTGTVAQVVHSSPGDTANSQNMRLEGDLLNIEVLVRIRFDKIPTGGNISANTPMRKQAGLNELYRPGLEIRTDGHIYHSFGVAAPGSSFGATTDLGAYVANDWYWIRSRTISMSGGVGVQSRAWKDGSAEPSTWLVDEMDTNATYMHGTGTVGLRSYTPATVSNFPHTIQFDDYTVRDLAFLNTGITGVTLTTTPSLPAGKLNTNVTGIVLTTTPTLPAGALATSITGVVLTTSPSLPAGVLLTNLTGVVLTTTPALPAGVLNTGVIGVTLTTTPSLPAGALKTSITGVVLTTTPTLPAGVISVAGGPQTVTGIVLVITPQMPAGVVQGIVILPRIDPNTWARFNNPTGTISVNRTKFGVGGRFNRRS